MKKYIFLIVAVFSTIICGYSKEAREKEQKIADNPMNFGQFIKSNWYVSLGVGAEEKFGNIADMDLTTSPVVDITLGKWLIPYVGFRFQYNYSRISGSIDTTAGFTNSFADSNGDLSGARGVYHFDIMFSIMNIVDGYYRDDRPYDIKPFFGLGFVSCFSGSTRYSKDNPVFGVVGSARLNDSFALNLELRGSPANAGHYGMTLDSRQRDRTYPVSLTVGLTYRLKPRGWSFRIPYGDYPELNMFERNAYVPMKKEVVIQKEIVTVRDTVSIEKFVKEERIAPAIIFFEIDKYEITKRNKVLLNHLANTINGIKTDQVFTITGYADAQTASKEYNLKLSRNRAEAVYYVLVNEFGIDKRRLKIDYKGGVDYMYYNDNALSRCVIVQ